MKQKLITRIVIAVSALAAVPSHGGVLLSAGTTTQNFTSLGTTLPSGWSASANASASSLGTRSTTIILDTWGSTTSGFKSVSSSDLASNATTTAQNDNTNRAFGLRQSGSFGDPGASFNFNFTTTGLDVTSLSIDLLMLSVQTRSTVFSIQYGLGLEPTSFTLLDTYSDPGSFGSTTVTFDSTDFGTALNNQSEVWFRVVALGSSSGSGSRDTVGIDNFSISTTTAIPEPSAALLGALGLLALLRRRR